MLKFLEHHHDDLKAGVVPEEVVQMPSSAVADAAPNAASVLSSHMPSLHTLAIEGIQKTQLHNALVFVDALGALDPVGDASQSQLELQDLINHWLSTTPATLPSNLGASVSFNAICSSLKRKHKGISLGVNSLWTNCADARDENQYTDMLNELRDAEGGPNLDTTKICTWLVATLADAVNSAVDFRAFDFATKLQSSFTGDRDFEKLKLADGWFLEVLEPFFSYDKLTYLCSARGIIIVALLDELAAIIAQECADGVTASEGYTETSQAFARLGSFTLGARVLLVINRIYQDVPCLAHCSHSHGV